MFSDRFRGRRHKDFCFSRQNCWINLRYLEQRKYRSGKMYWMTFWWPWPKVTAVTLINTNLLVCRIQWEPHNQSLQNVVAIWYPSGHAYHLIRFGGNFVGNSFYDKFSLKISDVSFQGQTLYWTYLRNVVEYGRMTERHVHLLGTTVPQVTLEFKCQQTRCLPLTTHVGAATILIVTS